MLVVFNQARTQTLLEKYGAVSQLNSERCLQLERAQSLASQFWETHEEMWPWLQETLSDFSQLPLPSIEYEKLRQQQEELRVRGQQKQMFSKTLLFKQFKTLMCHIICSKCES